jgi:cytochrome c553
VVKYSRLLTGVAIACFIASSAMAQNNWGTQSATQSDVLKSCQSCHGAGGNSEVTSTPRLNGQQAGYIVARLKALSDVTRTNPHAQIGMFRELSSESDATRTSVANYFAGQPPTGPKPAARAAEGRLIYESGNTADNVVACKLCHGAQGEGHDATPRIAGQHADYLMAQLRLFNIKFRKHVLMNPNTKTMTGDTMEALTSYLAND